MDLVSWSSRGLLKIALLKIHLSKKGSCVISFMFSVVIPPPIPSGVDIEIFDRLENILNELLTPYPLYGTIA